MMIEKETLRGLEMVLTEVTMLMRGLKLDPVKGQEMLLEMVQGMVLEMVLGMVLGMSDLSRGASDAEIKLISYKKRGITLA